MTAVAWDRGRLDDAVELFRGASDDEALADLRTAISDWLRKNR